MKDKISYIQRKIRDGVYESIPRRAGDKRLFENLTAKQEDAFNLIEEARGYDLSGIPQSRMRYSDAPGGFDYELTPQQLQRLFDYHDWRAHVYKTMPACHYAVIAYMDGASTDMIQEALKIGRGKASRYISLGLNEYCIMKGWGDQIEPHKKKSKMRFSGCAQELTKFIASEIDITGKPVWNAVDK